MSQKLSTVILIAIMCQLSHQKPTSEPSEQSMNEIYTECNSRITSRCFAMPDGCIKKLSCDVLLAVMPSETGADFMMFWNRNSSGPDNWVGAALSEDKKMGNDSITECILEKNNAVLVRQGLTYGGDKYGVNTVEPVRGITKEVGNVSNSIVSCSWSRVDDTMVKTLDFNILNKKYYILLAYGPVSDKDELKHHSNIWISEKAEYLAKVIRTGAPSTTSKSTSSQSTTSAKTIAPPPTIPTSAHKTTASGTPATTGKPTGTASGSPMTTNNSTATNTPSNTTSTGNNTTPNPTRMTTTGKPSGSATITFSVLLAIFVTIIFSLNL